MAEHEQIDRALKQCEEKFLNAFRASPLAVTLTSARDHRYIEVNDIFEQITGWRRSEVIGRTPVDIAIWVDPSQRVEFLRRSQPEAPFEILKCTLVRRMASS